MPEQEHVIDLIKKCLALSESPNEHEAAAALAKAQELLQKYNLQMADVNGRLDKEGGEQLINFPLKFEKELSDWKVRLIHFIAINNFCTVIDGGKTIHILGRKTNIQAVLEMGLWVTNQVDSMAFIATVSYSGAHKMAYRNSFILGILNTIYHRLEEQRRQWEKSSAQVTALVLYSKEEMNAFKYSQFPNLRYVTKYHSNNSRDGYSDGQRAGYEVSLNASSTQLN